MHVLHCLWVRGDRLAVWAEDSEAAHDAFGGRAPRRGRAPSSHPFDTASETIAAALGLQAPAGEPTTHVLWLPATVGRPQPSPRLVFDAAAKVKRPDRILPWTVRTAELGLDTAIPALVAPPPTTPGTVLGSGWYELGQISLLALELVMTGRILPGLTRAGDRLVAAWTPIPTTAQKSELRCLARGLPGLLRAEEPTGRPALEIVEGLLAAVADHVVRAAAPAVGGSEGPLGAWLEALGGDGEITAAHPELPALADAVAGWLRDASPGDGAMRTCFRLVAPEGPYAGDDDDSEAGGDDSWSVEFHLQSTDDPSLLVPAGRLWEADDTSDLGSLGEDHPHDALLRDLGIAARVYPPLAPALDAATPRALVTDADGAADFLTRGAGDLERSGFGVLLPDWTRRPARLGVRLTARDGGEDETPDSGAGHGRLGRDAIVAFDWKLSLGEDSVTEDELDRLAALKTPLVRVRGRWAWFDPEAVDAALEFVARSRETTAEPPGILDALRLAADLDVDTPGVPDTLPVLGIDADGVTGALLRGDVDVAVPPALPASFRGVLRPYQEAGLAWLTWLDGLGLGACLADDMGLGKTVQVLALLAVERDVQGDPPHPTLLVCPTSVLGNWVQEVEAFVPSLRFHVNHGSGRVRGEAVRDAAAGSDLFLTTYALAARDRDALAAVPWARIVLDEAQQVKNPRTRQSRAIRHLAAVTGARRVALTGTPLENRLGDLWSLMAFLNPGLLGSARAFRDTFATPIERYGDTDVLERLGSLVRPFMLRRVKADPAIAPELPDKIERDELCSLTREQASLYRSVADEMLGRVDALGGDDAATGIERRGVVLAALLRLKQICNHPALYLDDGSELAGRSGKLERLEELVDGILAGGERVLVFTQFATWGEMLRRHLQEVSGREVLFLHGGTPRRRRDDLVARFQADPGPPVFVISLKAGGVGLNLTAATHVIHYDRWWNPAVENQATDRAYRIGQTRGVDVHRFVCAGTIEERIGTLMRDKQRLADTIVGAGEGWLTRLDATELRRAVELSAGVGGGG
ncbi:MAG: DEAD/DEAH box helicase [Acidimicrobiia bacterium]|nr:DEAD/DEAH box helicase [Acidimicrobiia bacterium]